MSERSNEKRMQQWRKTQRIIRIAGGPGAGLMNFWQASSPSTLQRVLEICLSEPRTATAIPAAIENSQLRGPSLIVDAPLKLWMKLLDFETLSQIHRTSVATCAKFLLIGVTPFAHRVDRIRKAAERELRWREKHPRMDDQRR